MRFRAFMFATVMATIAVALTPRLSAQAAASPDWTTLQDETLRHFQALLRLDTSNPPGNEYLVTDYVKGVLEKEGISVEIVRVRSEAPQSDCAPEGQRSAPARSSTWATATWSPWTRRSGRFPPFSATRDGGYIYGRGSLDDKPHVVAGMMTLLTLKRLNVPLDRDVIFLVEAGEEGTRRCRHRLHRRATLLRLSPSTASPKGGNVTRVGGQVSSRRSRRRKKCRAGSSLTAIGPSGHGSAPLSGHGHRRSSRRRSRRSASGACRSCSTTTTREFFRRWRRVVAPDAARYRAVLAPMPRGGHAAARLLPEERAALRVDAAHVDLADHHQRRLPLQRDPVRGQGDARRAHDAR